MNKHLKILILGIALLFVFHIVNAKNDKDTNFAVIADKKVSLTVANTLETRSRGLMFVDNLPETEGMLFVFPDIDYRTFWMKNMKIPLDILFLRNNKIITIYENVPPCVDDPCPYYESKEKSDKVIELKSGFCEKYGVKPGRSISFTGKNTTHGSGVE